MTREVAILHMILRREELKHSVGDLDEDIKAFDMAIQALEQTRWIPVSERLPEEGENVLVTIYHKGCIPVIEKARLTDYTYWVGLGRDVNVRAWMPLPEPYKGESEDEGTENVVDCRTIPCAYRRYGPTFLLPGAPQKCVDCLNEMYGMEEGE